MKRNATLDYARLIAAIGIIVFHVGAPGAAVGYAALPFFLMLLLILAFPAALRQDFASYARSRASRLIWPWLTWSLVYGSLKAAKVIIGGKTVSSEFMPWMLLTGPALHLWFLPFAFIACIAMWPLARRFKSLQILGRTVCTVLGLSLSVSILMATQDRVAPPPLAQWLYALPAVFVGYVFALLANVQRHVLSTLLALSCLCCLLLFLDWPKGAMQLLLAGGAFMICLLLPLSDNATANRMASLSLTLYLAHPLIIAVLLRVTSIPEKSTSMAFAAVIGTMLFALVLQRMPLATNARAGSG